MDVDEVSSLTGAAAVHANVRSSVGAASIEIVRARENAHEPATHAQHSLVGKLRSCESQMLDLYAYSYGCDSADVEPALASLTAARACAGRRRPAARYACDRTRAFPPLLSASRAGRPPAGG